MKLARAIAVVATSLCIGCPSVHAEGLYLPAGSGVVITFDLPAQPVEHNGFIMFAPFVMYGAPVTGTQLFDEAGLLAKESGDGVFLQFVDPTSLHSGERYTINIDYSRLADGARGATLVLTVTSTVPGSFVYFDTADLRGWGFGDVATLPGHDAVVTSVVPFVATVPEPGLLWLLALGLSLVFGTSRARALRL
jgi:hypothetical protein